jgi:hypothetical protein
MGGGGKKEILLWINRDYLVVSFALRSMLFEVDFVSLVVTFSGFAAPFTQEATECRIAISFKSA